jgi:hypothetical protein
MDWINLAQGRDQWRALLNIEMKLRFQYIVGKLLEWMSNWKFIKKGSDPCSYLLYLVSTIYLFIYSFIY